MIDLIINLANGFDASVFRNLALTIAVLSMTFGALAIITPMLIESSDESEVFKNFSYFLCSFCVFSYFSIALIMFLLVKNV